MGDFLSGTEPKNFAVPGTFYLAMQIRRQIREAFNTNSILGMCQYVKTLISLLLYAEDVEISISDFGKRMSRTPETEDSQSHNAEPEGVVVREYFIVSKEITLGTIRVHSNRSRTDCEQDALMEYIASCCSELLDEYFYYSSRINELTNAQLNVLRSLHMPLDEQMAALCIENETLRSHKKSIYRKLGIKSRQQAVDIAERARKLAII